MNVRNMMLLIILSYSLCGYGHAELKEVQLLKNPFVKPGFVNANPAAQRINAEEAPALSERSLRATLSARQDSIANIDGLMLSVGDKVKGYELIAIGEGYAILVKNNKEITLHVSETHEKLK